MTSNDSTSPLLRMPPFRAIIMLFVITLVCMLAVSVISMIIMPDPITTRYVRVLAVLQDVIIFILPALIVAVISSTAPGKLLGIEHRPSVLWLIMAVLTLLVSVPAMNAIVEWNENISLPDSLSEITGKMRMAEDNARAVIEILMGGTTAMDLIMGILIIGVMAAVSEEIFFRGALLGIMMKSRMNCHIAVWLTAIIFSIFHFQFFGFVPRVILGAFFGYLTIWSGSIWVAAIVHAINNSIIVVTEWLTRSGHIDYDFSADGASGFTLILASVILTAGVIRISLKYLTKSGHGN